MRKKPLVSCIIPVYNREKFISNAIDSVLHQSYENLELIVVDDRSSDKTAAIVMEYANQNKSVVYTLNKNLQGPAGARNHGIGYAKGEYLAFLDSDDTWKLHHIEEMVNILDKNPDLDWVFSDIERYQNSQLITKSYFHEIAPHLFRIKTRKGIDCFIINDSNAFQIAVKDPIPCYIQSSVFKKAFFTTIRFDESLFGVEDALLQLEAINRNMTIGYTRNVNVEYYIHDNNISNSNNDGGDFKKSLDRNTELEKLYKKAFQLQNLTGKDKKALRKKQAELYFWRLGYLYDQATPQNRKQANFYYLKALRITPFDFFKWKSILGSFLKSFFTKKRSKI